jgi:hypothetical protein
MMRRIARLFVVVLAAGVTAGAAWRATENEQVRRSIRQTIEAIDSSAERGQLTLADLRSALYAYVAPGQGQDFWTSRASALLDEARQRVIDLDRSAAPAGHPLAESLDALDRLASAERRAREHVNAGQSLLAGDTIFSDASALVDAVAEAVAGARQAAVRQASSSEAPIANEQSLLAGAVLASWIVATICLLPTSRPRPLVSQAPPVGRVLDLSPPTPLKPPVPEQSEPVLPTTAEERKPPGLGASDLTALASLCADIGRVSDAAELGPLLGRVGRLIDASGVIIWVVTPDGLALTPAAAHGYDEPTLARIGSIPLSGDNLTVTAFCRAAPLTRGPTGDGPAALAVPVVAGAGPVGVLSAEVTARGDVQVAAPVAAVLAAMLATLFPAPSGGAADESLRHQRA